MTQPIRNTCTPRPEVLSGELKDEVFAAKLNAVIAGEADPVYQQPERFFANTFPTDGLRTLLREALGRATGVVPASSPIIRLETAFGGGKTHNLIALYHAATGAASVDDLNGLVDAPLIPAPGSLAVAGVVGTDLSSSDGRLHKDGIRTFTLWGELAYQLGGPEGYAKARRSDEERAAPGTALLDEVLSEQGAVIMIDEIARYLEAAEAIAVGKSTLAEQTVAFLMALLDYAAGRDRVSVVFTLASSGDAFARQTERLHDALSEARKVSARQEMVIQPTGERDIAAIVRHRLFESVDPAAGIETAAAYASAYRSWSEQGVNLPGRALQAEYTREFEAAYPFHPELLTTLERKTSTIPNFQKTRGALRLLARVVRELWNEGPKARAIHLHHIPLHDPGVAQDLTSRLDRPAFQQVIEADIVSALKGSKAKAQEADRDHIAAGRPPYTQRVATTVFIHSLTQGVASGVEPADLRLAVLEPGNDPLLVERAVDRLTDTGWFFDFDGIRYRFKTEPSLNKIVADETDMVGRTAAKAELDKRIRQVWRRGVFQPLYFPDDAAGVDDNAGPPKLVVLHYDAATVRPDTSEPPELVRRIFDYAGSMGAFRRFRNNLVGLVADADQTEHLVDVMRRYLAIGRILSDGERMRAFSEEDRKKLKKMAEAAELDVRVAITRAYRHLYVPRADAPPKHGNLAHEVLPAQDQGQVQRDQSEVVLRLLRDLGKTLTGDDKTLSAAYVRSRAWEANRTHMTTEELRKAFAQRIALPFLLDPNQLKKTIRNGIEQRQWLLFDAQAGIAYDHESPPPAVQISDDMVLYTPEEAAARALPIKGKEPKTGEHDHTTPVVETCPVCRNPVPDCTCGEVIEETVPLRGEGPPQQAVQQLLDACHDAGVQQLASLTIRLDADGPSGADALRRLGLALAQLGQAEYLVSLSMTAQFNDQQYMQVSGHLSDTLYKRLKQTTDALAMEAGDLRVNLTVEAAYPDGLPIDGDRFATIHDVLTTTMGAARIALSAKAATEAPA
ncbi:ATP-binding protein [Rhodocaloribacter sp.]